MKHRYRISVRGSMSPAVAERVSRVHAMAVVQANRRLEKDIHLTVGSNLPDTKASARNKSPANTVTANREVPNSSETQQGEA
ncbi:MAG: hypothetical protein WC749_15230, partial [Dehalococcoidia bacterium]